jgi:hypothetical protein
MRCHAKYEKISTHYTSILHNDDVTIYKKQQACLQDRIKLIHIDDEYSGLTQGICGTVSGIYAANEICKSVNRPESIIWVKWDNGIELGLIEGIDKYEIMSDDTNTNSIIRLLQATIFQCSYLPMIHVCNINTS